MLAVHGRGVHGFTLDTHVGEFILTRPYMKIPKVSGTPNSGGGERQGEVQLVVLPHDTYHLCVCGCRVCQCVFVCVRGMWLGVWHATHGRRLELLGSLRGPLGDPQAAGQHVVAFFFPPRQRCLSSFALTGATLAVVPLHDLCHRRQRTAQGFVKMRWLWHCVRPLARG